MFGIGGTELVVLLVLALLVLGPDKVPTVARTLAKMYREIRTTGAEFSRVIRDEVKTESFTDISDLEKEVRSLADPLNSRFDTDDKPRGATGGSSSKPPAQERPRIVHDWTQTVSTTLFDEDDAES